MDPAYSNYESWLKFDSLDLDPPAAKRSLSDRMQKLNLDSSVRVSSLGKKVDAYVARSHNAALFFHEDEWSKLSEHKIIPSPAVERTCETMKTYIKEVVDAMRSQVDYNGLNIVCEFIRFCETERLNNPKINDYELLNQFQPDSKDEASLSHGSTCVGKARELVRQLRDLSVEAHVVLEYEQPGHPAIHAAVVVPCQDGLLLVEVEHPIPIIAIKPDKPWSKAYPPNLTLSMELIEVPGNFHSKAPVIVKKETFKVKDAEQKGACTEYLLRPDPNPDNSIMKRWLVGKDTWFYPVSTSPGSAIKEKHTLQVNIAKGRLTFGIGEKKFRLPLAAIHPESRSFDRNELEADESLKLTTEQLNEYKEIIFGAPGEELGGPFFDTFNSGKTLLLEQLFTIASHKEFLKNLREK